METANYFRCGFRINSILEATVCCVKNDRVRFSITNVYGEECDAWYYISGERINPHQVFQKGEKVDVRVMSILKDGRTNPATVILVRPEKLPVDLFLEEHPIGSKVTGIIIAIHNSGMVIRLAENVHCMVKRCKHAKTGIWVACLLNRYNANRKVLFATVL